MSANKGKHKDVRQPGDVVYHGMGSWGAKRIKKKGKGSRTPGRMKRAETCQLTSIAGMPRKYWSQSRSYKNRNYPTYCAAMDKVNA